MISIGNAPHSTWASICDGWHLTAAPTLSVIQERMPPGTAEEWHRHSRVRQFFFVLGGVLTLEVEGEGDAEFLVISDGISREDREEA